MKLPLTIFIAIIAIISLVTPVTTNTNTESTTIVSVVDNDLAPIATLIGNESGDVAEYYSYAVNSNTIMVHTTTKNVFNMELSTVTTIQ